MVNADLLAARRDTIANSPDLTALLARLTRRAELTLSRSPAIPTQKALLSTDGGFCPHDGAQLTFDPWSPTAHRCPRCGRAATGERHDRHWVRFQHLWLAERAAELAAVGVLGGHGAAAEGAARLLRGYAERYPSYPNRDNVLGPARLFFSTYLESIWLTNYLAAATLLRDGGGLDERTVEAVSSVADEAANVIGEFNEGYSNRQTWHAAALTAVAVWFEDEGLAATAVESDTGLIGHLVRGFGEDGTWYEGENYHLFALRGLLTGLGWARAAGVDVAADERLAPLLTAALLAPSRTALPDLTFPARKDSRYGISLAQPMYLELWEVAAGRLGDAGTDASQLDGWLGALYASPSPEAEAFDSYLHEAGDPPPARRTRADLSWWSLLEMAPALDTADGGWQPRSVYLPSQGLAVLRHGDVYASLESGAYGGGHGHPDRLHLTVHARGVHWLPDPGTGSYVTPDLFWYRSTLAHGAPRLDGTSQPMNDAVPEAFGADEEWSWVRGRFGDVHRTVVLGPRYLVDVVELGSEEEHRLELPWHFAGTADGGGASWSAAPLAEPFVSGGERLAHDSDSVTLRFKANADRAEAGLDARLHGPGELIRAEGPGVPGAPRTTFYLQRASGRGVRFIAVLEPHGADEAPAVRAVRSIGEAVEIDTASGTERVTLLDDRVRIEAGDDSREVMNTIKPIVGISSPALRPERPEAHAPWIAEPPPLDGTLDGFDDGAPLMLDTEDQYRRSEEPYVGPDELCAAVYLNWSDDALFVAVDVRKPALAIRGETAAPLRLDNEPDDIHSDGVQLYLRDASGTVLGWLIVPAVDGAPALRVRPVAGTAAAADTIGGSWAETDDGYAVTLRVALPGLADHVARGGELGFDLIVNEMRPGRERRAGQLVWSGGGGWVWLRGDRQDPSRFGTLRPGS